MLKLSARTPAQSRRENLNGVDYLVVSGIPAREQVMNDYLVPGNELSHFVGAWNGVPIVIEHPKENDGSANAINPDVPIIGRFYNAAWDEATKRLTGEYWIDVAAAGKTNGGKYVLDSLAANQMLETSTGYWADEDASMGAYNGVPYKTIHRNLRPDHIAILPQSIGACSLVDGCGVNRNDRTFINCEACPHKLNAGALHAVLSGPGAQANIPTPALESAHSVARRLLDKEIATKKGHRTMKLEDLLKELETKGVKIKVNAAAEDAEDKTPSFELEAFPEPAKPEPGDDDEAEEPEEPQSQFTPVELNALKERAKSAPALLKDMPAAIAMAQNAANREKAEKTSMIAKIKANKANVYSDEELASMSLPVLTKLDGQLSVNYGGFGMDVIDNAQADEVVVPPAVFFAPVKNEEQEA